MLTGTPGAQVKDAKKEIITIKENIFDFLWINYTIFNTVTSL